MNSTKKYSNTHSSDTIQNQDIHEISLYYRYNEI